MGKSTKRRTPGDGSLYRRANGLWIASLDLGFGTDGQRKRWQGSSKTQAGALKKLHEARKEVSIYGSVGKKKMNVGAWLDYWLESIARPSVRPKTYVDYERCIRLHLKPRLASQNLSKLTPEVVRAVEVEIARDKTAATAAGVHRVLSAALASAQREGHVPRNVAALVSAPKARSHERSALTSTQAKKLMDLTAHDPLGSRWAFALLTGARQGESLGLEWDRVDLRDGSVDISWQLQRLSYTHGCGDTCGLRRAGNCPQRHLKAPSDYEVRTIPGSGLFLTRPKTSRGTRLIPLPPTLIAALKTLRKAELGPGFVWTSRKGLPIDPKHDAIAWDQALTDAGLPDVPLHSARHTTATLLMEMGVDVKIIQSIMGHAQAVTTQSYQHADISMARSALDRLGESLAT